jgi:hypothetical protein
MSSGEGEGAGARLFHFLADRDRGFSFRDPNYIFTNFAKQREGLVWIRRIISSACSSS